jgi:hypothetical protein
LPLQEQFLLVCAEAVLRAVEADEQLASGADVMPLAKEARSALGALEQQAAPDFSASGFIARGPVAQRGVTRTQPFKMKDVDPQLFTQLRQVRAVLPCLSPAGRHAWYVVEQPRET